MPEPTYCREVNNNELRSLIAMATALQMIFLDEANSALDPETVKEITKPISHLSNARIMVVVTHEIGFVQSTSDTIVFMYHDKSWNPVN